MRSGPRVRWLQRRGLRDLLRPVDQNQCSSACGKEVASQRQVRRPSARNVENSDAKPPLLPRYGRYRLSISSWKSASVAMSTSKTSQKEPASPVLPVRVSPRMLEGVSRNRDRLSPLGKPRECSATGNTKKRSDGSDPCPLLVEGRPFLVLAKALVVARHRSSVAVSVRCRRPTSCRLPLRRRHPQVPVYANPAVTSDPH